MLHLNGKLNNHIHIPPPEIKDLLDAYNAMAPAIQNGQIHNNGHNGHLEPHDEQIALPFFVWLKNSHPADLEVFKLKWKLETDIAIA